MHIDVDVTIEMECKNHSLITIDFLSSQYINIDMDSLQTWNIII